MKLLRRLLIFLVVLVIVIVAGVFFYIDAIAKTAIEKGATYALGVQTTLQRANIGILRGQFSMNGLRVANPEGFDSALFLKLAKGEVDVTMGSLRQDTVELPLLALDDLDMTLEKKGGQSNYKVILDNLKQFQSEEKKEAGKQKEGKQFIIREIVITDVNVEAHLFGVGGQLDRVHVPIDEIRLTDVSSKGLTTSQTTDIILQAVLAAVMKSATDLPADFVNDLGGALEGLTGLREMGITTTVEMAGKAIEDLGKGDIGTAEGAVGEGIEDISKGIEEGIGGLLGGKKKDE